MHVEFATEDDEHDNKDTWTKGKPIMLAVRMRLTYPLKGIGSIPVQ